MSKPGLRRMGRPRTKTGTGTRTSEEMVIQPILYRYYRYFTSHQIASPLCVRTRVRTSSDSEVMNLSRSVSIVQKIACPSPLMSEIVSVSVHICTESYWFLVYQLLVTPKFNFRKELHRWYSQRQTTQRQTFWVKFFCPKVHLAPNSVL